MENFIRLSAQYLFLAVPLLALGGTLFAKRVTRLNIIKLAVVALAAALCVDLLLEWLVYVPRPFVVEHVTPLFPHVADSSFPSSHTLLTMTIAAVMFAFKRWLGLLLTLVALLVGFARVLAHVHYPLDIIGSAIIAVTITYLAWLALRRFKLLR